MFQNKNEKNLIEKEWGLFLKREKSVLKGYGKAKQSFIDRKLKAVVPEGLKEKLDTAFYKAFQMILQSGTGIIEKTYPKEKLETDYKVREYRQNLKTTRKNLKAGVRTASSLTARSVAGAGVEGAALGLLGIGLPDIPLFMAVIFRSLYTLCLNYGIDYKKPEEQELLLELMVLSLYRGEDFAARDAKMNQRIYEIYKSSGRSGAAEEGHRDREELTREAAATLSGELLYLKFLQGVPIVGIIGGIYDSIYLKRITDYAALKLERRYLLGKLELK